MSASSDLSVEESQRRKQNKKFTKTLLGDNGVNGKIQSDTLKLIIINTFTFYTHTEEPNEWKKTTIFKYNYRS